MVGLGIQQKQLMILYCDNHGVLKPVHNEIFHECIKHFEVLCHFICEHVQHDIQRQFFPTQYHRAYIFTKYLTHSKFEAFCKHVKTMM
jgi:hypothetical protein